MNIEMHPSAIVGGASSVEIEDLALVPALVLLLHRSEVEGSKTHGGVRVDPRGPLFVGFLHVGVVAIVPDVDGDFMILWRKVFIHVIKWADKSSKNT